MGGPLVEQKLSKKSKEIGLAKPAKQQNAVRKPQEVPKKEKKES